MNPYLVLLLIALLYILAAGGLSVLRREGFSLQLAVEVIVVAGLLVIFSLVTGQVIHPVPFLIVIYLLTMRARLMVDLGNLLARRGHHHQAANVYSLALRLKPDGPSRQIVRLNQAVHQLQQGQLAQATTMLEHLLAEVLSITSALNTRPRLAITWLWLTVAREVKPKPSSNSTRP